MKHLFKIRNTKLTKGAFMKFVFSILFMSGLFLVVPSSEAQDDDRTSRRTDRTSRRTDRTSSEAQLRVETDFEKGDHCLHWDMLDDYRFCRLYTKTCRAPRGGEDRVVRCQCSKLLGEDGREGLAILSQEDTQIIRNLYEKLNQNVANHDRSEFFSFIRSNENLAFGVANSDSRAKEDALNTCDSVISDLIVPLLKKEVRDAGGSSSEMEVFVRMFTQGHFRKDRIRQACTEAYVCDGGSRLEPKQIRGISRRPTEPRARDDRRR